MRPILHNSKFYLLEIYFADASLPPPYFFERNPDGSLRRRVEGWSQLEEGIDLRGGANIVDASEPFVQAQGPLDGQGPSLSLGNTDNDDSRSLLLGPESLLESESLAASSMLDLCAQFTVVLTKFILIQV